MVPQEKTIDFIIGTDDMVRYRECYYCAKPINFYGFAIFCQFDIRYNDLLKIWNDPNVELFCCTCLALAESGFIDLKGWSN